MRFNQYLSERFLTFLHANSAERELYAKEVYDLLQKAYEYIGGLKGSGFNDVEDMKKNIPIWKLVRQDGKIVAVAMYKDKEGRKRVAIASYGSVKGKQRLAEIVKDDMEKERAYAEISGGSLRFSKRQVSNFEDFVIPPEEVEKIVDDEIIYPVDPDDPEVEANPRTRRIFLSKKIGSEWKTKIMTGTPFVDIY